MKPIYSYFDWMEYNGLWTYFLSSYSVELMQQIFSKISWRKFVTLDINLKISFNCHKLSKIFNIFVWHVEDVCERYLVVRLNAPLAWPTDHNPNPTIEVQRHEWEHCDVTWEPWHRFPTFQTSIMEEKNPRFLGGEIGEGGGSTN
jgi:hypothetical protein